MTSEQVLETFRLDIQDSNPKEAAACWRELARLAMAEAATCEEQYRSVARLTMPGDIVRDLSPNRRICRQERARRAKGWRVKGRLAWLAAGRPVFSGPVRVEITVRRGRVVDDDNAVSACKAVRDSLWGPDCMLPADDWRFFESYQVRQETGGRWRMCPEVEIWIMGEKI
jgi:hypothetical protein